MQEYLAVGAQNSSFSVQSVEEGEMEILIITWLTNIKN